MPTVEPLAGDIDFSAEGADEVLQNVGVILATRRGTVPLDREFGLAWDYLDDPRPQVIQQLRAEVAETVETHEPRATVERVAFDGERGATGRLIPNVTVSIDLDATS